MSYTHIKIALAMDECGTPLPGVESAEEEGPKMKVEEPSRVSMDTVIDRGANGGMASGGGATRAQQGGVLRRKMPSFMGGVAATKRSNTNVG